MKCKNCSTDLSSQSKYCEECGAKVIKERITFKNLLSDLFKDSFGWDNKFFFTIRNLILRPDILFKEYINGTRKKFVNPFGFFAISVALALLVFNLFSEEYLQASEFSASELQITDSDTKEGSKKFNIGEQSDSDQVIGKNMNVKQQDFNRKFQQNILKYFNFYSFLLLPIYAFIAFIIFGKPYNYGEHFIVNAYIQGLLLLLAIIFFLTELLVGFSANFANILASCIFYTYSYQRLYKLSATSTIISWAKFIGVLIVLVLLSIFSGFIIMLVIKKLSLMSNM